MKKNVIILLTGTVKPGNMSYTQLKDPKERYTQYINAIKFWLEYTKLKVIFVENSNTDVSKYFKSYIDSNRLEILTFQGNDFDRNLGKGYGELVCLEYAYQKSNNLRNADIVFKITGRHKVLNFNTFLNHYLNNKVDIIVDFKRAMRFCDSRFFAFSPDFLSSYLFKYKPIINDSENIFFENILCKAALCALKDGYKFSPYITLPRIEGSSGTFNEKYNSNIMSWFKNKFKYDFKFKILTQ